RARLQKAARRSVSYSLLRIEMAFYTSLHEGPRCARSRRACADGNGAGVRIQPRGDPEDSPAWSLAAAAARRSGQPRLRKARRDRARRAPVLRGAALRHRLGALRQLPRAVPRLSGRTPRAFGLEQVESKPQSLLN